MLRMRVEVGNRCVSSRILMQRYSVYHSTVAKCKNIVINFSFESRLNFTEINSFQNCGLIMLVLRSPRLPVVRFSSNNVVCS